MDEQKPRPWYAHLPAKLAAVVVFLVALTTLVGNLLELADKRAAPAVVTRAAQPAPQASPQPAEPAGPLELRVDRIVVQHDGSPGTTDWRFSIEVEGEPMLDLAYTEDSRADVDMNVVKTGGGLDIELQGTAEALPFGREALNRLLDLADTGTRQLFALQRGLVGQYLNTRT